MVTLLMLVWMIESMMDLMDDDCLCIASLLPLPLLYYEVGTRTIAAWFDKQEMDINHRVPFHYHNSYLLARSIDGRGWMFAFSILNTCLYSLLGTPS